MSVFSVDRAIRRRFAEANAHIPGLQVIENDPFPEFTNTTTLVSDGEGEVCGPVAWMYPRGGSRVERVLVFQENEKGHNVDIAHHISFQHVRNRWRSEEPPVGFDRDCLGCTSAVNSAGETVYGPDLVRIRPSAEPESYYYDFHVQSRDYGIAEMLLATVRRMFPARGALEVTYLDGSQEFVDMLLTTNPFRSSSFDATLTPGDPGVRRYRWSMQYEVEGYDDNTLEGEWQQTIREPCAPVDLFPEPNIPSSRT